MVSALHTALLTVCIVPERERSPSLTRRNRQPPDRTGSDVHEHSSIREGEVRDEGSKVYYEVFVLLDPRVRLDL